MNGQAMVRAAFQERISPSPDLPADSPARRPVFYLRCMAWQYLLTERRTAVSDAQAQQTLNDFTWFKELRTQLHENPDSLLFSTINLGGNHWIEGLYDVSTRKWSYGDSQANPLEEIEGLYFEASKALSLLLDLPCVDVHPPTLNTTLVAGQQLDGHSCGYFSINTLEHHVFGRPLGSPATAPLIRIRSFLHLYHEHLQDHGPIVNGHLEPRYLGTTPNPALAELDQFPSRGRSRMDNQLASLREDFAGTLHVDTQMEARDTEEMFFSSGSSDSDSDDEDDGNLTDEAYMQVDWSDAALEARYQQAAARRAEQDSMDVDPEPDFVPPAPSNKRMSKLARRTRDATLVKENPDRWDNFERRVKALDPQARLHKELQPRHVWCSWCINWIPLKEVFQFSCYEKHRKDECPMREQGAIRPATVKEGNILSFFKAQSKPGTHIGTESQEVVSASYSCPGLTKAFDPRIVRYLARTGAAGGGAPPIKILKQSIRLQQDYLKTLKSRGKRKGGLLTKKQLKAELDNLEEREYKWINHGPRKLVRASDCTSTTETYGVPCQARRKLRSNPIFMNALRRKPPPDENIKYTPLKFVRGFYRDLCLKYRGLDKLIDKDGKESYPLRMAKIVHRDSQGEYRHEIFAGMIESMVLTEERRMRKKGTQGLVRSAPFVNHMHSIALTSPAAYKKLRKIFGGPSMRSFQ